MDFSAAERVNELPLFEVPSENEVVLAECALVSTGLNRDNVLEIVRANPSMCRSGGHAQNELGVLLRHALNQFRLQNLGIHDEGQDRPIIEYATQEQDGVDAHDDATSVLRYYAACTWNGAKQAERCVDHALRACGPSVQLLLQLIGLVAILSACRNAPSVYMALLGTAVLVFMVFVIRQWLYVWNLVLTCTKACADIAVVGFQHVFRSVAAILGPGGLLLTGMSLYMRSVMFIFMLIYAGCLYALRGARQMLAYMSRCRCCRVCRRGRAK